MLLVLIYCIYVVSTSRAAITRNLTLTGLRARQFAITLLILMIPVQIMAGAILRAVLPESVVHHAIAGRAISFAILIALALGLAVAFRALDRRSPVNESDAQA
jgi:uncharacterized membrane protein YdjX (TVP38/TMEM64 family)